MITLLVEIKLFALLFLGLWFAYCLYFFVRFSSWCHWLAIFCDCGSSWASSILFCIVYLAQLIFCSNSDKKIHISELLFPIEGLKHCIVSDEKISTERYPLKINKECEINV